MLKTMKFFWRGYGLQLLATYAGFAGCIILLAHLMGSGAGLAGIYTMMFPAFVSLFGLLFAMGSYFYVQVALGMGARRAHCFFAMESMLAVTTALVPLLYQIIHLANSGLPGADDYLLELSAAQWLTCCLSGLAFAQFGLMFGYMEKGMTRRVISVLSSVLMFGTFVALMVFLQPFVYESDALALWVPRGFRIAAASYGTLMVICMSVVYKFYQKAVVRL